MFKSLLMRLLGRDIRGVSKRVLRMKADIAANIKSNDAKIANAALVITALKDAQDALMAENTTGASLVSSFTVM